VGGGGGYTIHLSYGWVVEEVIHPVEEVITLMRLYCQLPRSSYCYCCRPRSLTIMIIF